MNVSWSSNNAEVEYSLSKAYFFREDLSVAPESQKLMLPNIPMIVRMKGYLCYISLTSPIYLSFVQSALASLRNSDFIIRSAVGSMLELLKQQVFGQLSVSDVRIS